MEDFKQISLRLFHKKVLIMLMVSSESYQIYGSEVVGKIIARNWGKFTNWKTIDSSPDTIVSLSIQMDDDVIVDIPCCDIKFITTAF